MLHISMDFQHFPKFLQQSWNFISIYPDIFLILAILFLITFLVILDYYFKYKLKLTNSSFILFLLIGFSSIYLIINSLNINFFTFNTVLVNDLFSNYLKLIFMIFSLFIFFLSKHYLNKENINNFEYYLLLLLSLLGSFLIVTAQDLISLYLGIELQSLSFYLLATFKQYNNFSSEAGIKYFILGAFSSGLLLFGCTLIYGFTGTINFYDLELLFQNAIINTSLYDGLLVGVLFFLSGILFKLAAAPFHMWSPDVYEGAPTSITAFFAIVPKIGILAILVRFSIFLFGPSFIEYKQFIIISAFLSILIGCFGAIYQVKLKRLLAYSAISHVGFLLIGVSIFSIEGLHSVFFYVIIYMLLSLNIFAILLSIRKVNNNLKIKKINELIILLKSNKTLALIFCLVLFSVAGIPPLMGFFSKFYIFIAGLQFSFYALVIFAAIFSVISAIYYIRLIKLMFFKESSYIFFLQRIPLENSLIISFTFLFNFFFFFFPNILVLEINQMISSLLF